MPEAVDVGSVLGGRYKVTAYVLASAEKDLVLDGVDQVLNRPVSILVASPSNASQVATSAREVATGERPGNIQVLDLGITDAGTYLVTNRAPAADLLDLVIQQDAPYIEPFFTDTLGSEIFGVARSTEPETYEDDDDDDYDHHEQERRPSRLPKARMPRFGRGAAAGAAGGAAAGAAAASGQAEPGTAPQDVSASRPADGNASVPPPPSAPPRVIPADERNERPKVSVWSEEDYDRPEYTSSQRPASRFPAAAAAGGATAAGSQYDDDGPYEDGPHGNYDNDEDRANNPRFTRLLVGIVLALVIIGAVVLAVTQLRPIFDPPVANDSTTTESTVEATDGQTPSPSDSGSATPSPELVPPVATSVTRLVPDNPELNSQTDGDLGAIIDDNPASFWGSLVYANETFGGLAQNLALVVELEEPSSISEVQIEQLNSSGGSFTVLLNDEPTLEGATQIAQSGFTGPSVTFNVPQTNGAPPTAQYVIVNFTQLPRLSNVQAQYPWGMRIAEINVS